jgi:hypothetical protein
MHPAMKGALVGLAIAVFLVAIEYLMVKKAVKQRATPNNPNPAFDAQDRNRVRAVVNFCLFLPPAFAAGFWLID